MQDQLHQAIEKIANATVTNIQALSGGCVGDVYKVTLSNRDNLVAKVGDTGSGLALEGLMLRYLADHSELPVPTVLHGDDSLLLMTFIDGTGQINAKAEIHAADLVASLHGVSAKNYGFERDTVIGGLHQPNPRSNSWLDFFTAHRLLEMADQGLVAGRLPKEIKKRIEAFAGKLDKWLVEPTRPSLIHGDMWGGNVLAANGRITGFIDPAIYFADPEIELAFTTLFSTFGDAFFSRYNEHRPLAPGFFEERRDIYNLYPLLVHVRLFGGSYVGSVDGILRKFGF
jgi:fructosamine-3-kinase